VEWAILRSNNNGADYARLQAFITANPSWPNIAMFRRRAEAMLWEEHADVAAIRALTGEQPVSAKGRLHSVARCSLRATASPLKP
jgi:soluble lytic murein transglycosylase